MKDREYIISLFEEYKNLLNIKEQNYFTSYYYEDLSLNEIALNNKLSKAYIGKKINIIKSKLKKYEELLSNYENKIKLEKIINKIEDKKIKQELLKLLD